MKIEAMLENGNWTDVDALKAVIENMIDGVVVVDRDGKFLFFNRVAEKILGMGSIDSSPSDWTSRFGCFTPDGSRLISPDELPLARSMRGEEVSDFEMLIRNPGVPNGALIRTSSLPLRDEDGVLQGGVVCFRDVTDLKKAEERLERLSNAVEQTADSVFITNKDFVIEYVNPAFVQTTGYEREEALGQTPGLLKSGRHTKEFYENLRNTISSGGVFRGTIINRKKSGQLYRTEQTITPMKTDNGETAAGTGVPAQAGPRGTAALLQGYKPFDSGI